LKTKSFLSAAAFLSCLALVGCGPSLPETATVSGRVTFNGKPVPRGRVVFQPEKGRQASAALDADGRYTLTTFKDGDGALLGKHIVTITASRVVREAQKAKSIEDEMRVGMGRGEVLEWLLPPKYSRTESTPLKAEVIQGQNTIDFKLP
jgi:hypothetical protein